MEGARPVEQDCDLLSFQGLTVDNESIDSCLRSVVEEIGAVGSKSDKSVMA